MELVDLTKPLSFFLARFIVFPILEAWLTLESVQCITLGIIQWTFSCVEHNYMDPHLHLDYLQVTEWMPDDGTSEPLFWCFITSLFAS